jgi:hypothetical protein
VAYVLAAKWISIGKSTLMKLNIHPILEALFFPKPHDYLKRNYTDNQHGQGLILIPVPNNENIREKIINENNR